MTLRRALRHLLCRPGRRELLIRILDRLNNLEELMSDLDNATADLTAAVADIATLIAAPVEDLQAKLDEALAKLTEAQSNDVTDAETISRLQGEVVDLLTDASQNVALITEQTAKLRSFAPGQAPTDPPAVDPESTQG